MILTIIYSGAVFSTDNILNTLVLSQTTNMDKIARRNFLGFQVLVILNTILLDNLLIYGKLNAKTLWAHL